MGVDIQIPGAAWSRRRFIANGLLPVLLVPSLSRALTATLAPPSSARPDAHDASAAAGRAGPSGKERAARLTTPVYVNGHGPYHFLVDTGAERSVLAAELASRLDLPHCPPVLLQGIILAQKTLEVEVAQLETGRLTCTDLRVPILPGAMLEADGYLGLDVLNGHRVVFDFRRHALRIEKPQGFFSALWGHDNQIRVPAQGESGRLRSTDCYVDGVRATAFIDSGAQVSVCNPPLFAQLQHRKSPPMSFATVQLSGVTGGTIVGSVTEIDTIRLPGLSLTVTPVVIADLRVFALWGLKHKPAILIGMNCLRAFSSVAIDYARKDVLFQIPSAATAPMELAQADSGLG